MKQYFKSSALIIVIGLLLITSCAQLQKVLDSDFLAIAGSLQYSSGNVAPSAHLSLFKTGTTSTINVSVATENAVATTNSNTNGTFLFDILEQGNYYIKAVDQDGLVAQKTEIEISDKSINVGILIFQNVGNLSGTVTLEGTSNYSGITIFIPNTTYITSSNATGLYELTGIPEGSYTLWFEQTGYTINKLENVLVVSQSSVSANTIELTTPTTTTIPETILTNTISGTVTLEGTGDYSGISILIPNTEFRTTSNTSGLYELIGVPEGTYTLIFSKTGYGSVSTENIVVAQGSPTNPSNIELALSTFSPTGFTASNTTSFNIDLNWTKAKPSTNIVIKMSQTSSPTNFNDGDLLFEGNATSYVHNFPSNGTFYYSIWEIDGSLISTAKTASVTIPPFWAPVGKESFSNGGISNSQFAFAIDSTNSPYVAFADETNSNKATVRKFNSGSWVIVGSAGFSAGELSGLSMTLDSIDGPYVAYKDQAKSNKATVMKLDSDSWVTVGSAGFSPGPVGESSLAIDSNNEPYLAILDNGSLEITLMKYDSDTMAWSIVGSGGFSSSLSIFMAFALDSKSVPNVPYVAYDDLFDGDKLFVKKFDGADWVMVGSTAVSDGAAAYIKIALDSNNNPYVAYTDEENGNKATVKKLNGSTWETVGSVGFSSGTAESISLGLDATNAPYVAFQDGTIGNKATVMKYNGSAWVIVGSAGFSNGFVSEPSPFIAIGSNNVPYVGFVRQSRPTVMDYE